MVKYTVTVRRLLSTNCLICLNILLGWRLVVVTTSLFTLEVYTKHLTRNSASREFDSFLVSQTRFQEVRISCKVILQKTFSRNTALIGLQLPGCATIIAIFLLAIFELCE